MPPVELGSVYFTVRGFTVRATAGTVTTKNLTAFM